MSLNCPSCGNDTVESGEYYAQDHLVCTSCGTVIEEDSFENSSLLDGTTLVAASRNKHTSSVQLSIKNVPKSFLQIAFYKRTGKKVQAGLNKSKDLASAFKFNQDMTNELTDLYSELVKTEVFFFRKQKVKEILAGCCAYKVMRERDIAVCVSSICNFLDCTASEFSLIYKQFLNVSSFKIRSTSAQQLVPVVLSDLKLGEEAEDMSKKTLEIINLADKLGFTSGRTATPIVIGAAFLAWQAMNIQRMKTSFQTFCSVVGLSKLVTARRRALELKHLLVDLGKQIPWLTADRVTVANVILHIDSIIKYSYAFIKDKSALSDKGKKDNNQNPDVVVSSKRELVQGESSAGSCKKQKKEELSYEAGYVSDDISDSEIDSYIKSDTEIKEYEKLLSKFEQK
ncbi:transcription factor IIIB 50 kDa subunit-like [Limulus polyphemus]|uniref:Transcription factor IIIB 50 kDa subunit-like n=1 Tax=Limulus polyphemus TaxID=6850 RepID=A0ABM1BY94_LIMPO|nr:transcription factor IIIB 50 kDa subunit-like [Limulus polyphemus]XP_022258823.1 transcription factor IIIB 50 kDa subunit-like [Limulus polyphemus]